MKDETKWIEAAAQGDMEAFHQIYLRYVGEVTRTVGRYMGPGSHVEDAVQEAFIELHKSLGKVSEPERFGGWVHRVARNVAISHVRKRSRSVNLVTLQALKEPTNLWRRLKAREKLRAFYAALDCLSEEQREALIMYEIEGHTLQEIADARNTSINTIASRVRRGREQMVKILKRVQKAGILENEEQA